jgi:hypothetical protein
MFTKIKKFISLPKEEKTLFLEALFTSFLIRIYLLIVPANKVERFIQKKSNKIKPNNNFSTETIYLIRKSIKRIAKYSLWRNLCLEQSLTAMIMLKRKKIPYTIYIGAKKNNEQIIGHFWITAQSVEIVKKGSNDIIILKEYSNF